jgi:hypothetical protein
MPGWSVVLKKEARGRRMNPTEEEHSLGQEGSRDDLQVLANIEPQPRVLGAVQGGDEAPTRNGHRRRRARVDVL